MKAVEIKKGSTLRLTERAFFIPNGRFHHAVLASHRQCGDRGGQFSDGYESVGLNVVLPCKVEQNLPQHLQENIAMKRIDYVLFCDLYNGRDTAAPIAADR